MSAAISASTAVVVATAAVRKKSQCDALTQGYQHYGASLEQQQAYAACIPSPRSDESHFTAQVFVALLLLSIPIAIGVGISWWRRSRSLDDAATAAVLTSIGWLLFMCVAALVVAGVSFVLG